MEKLLLFVGLIFVMSCGSVGYRLKRGTGDHGKIKGEVFWNVVELDLWKKK